MEIIGVVAFAIPRSLVQFPYKMPSLNWRKASANCINVTENYHQTQSLCHGSPTFAVLSVKHAEKHTAAIGPDRSLLVS